MDRIDLLDAQIIQKRVKALATRLGKPEFTISAQPTGDGSPHLEISDAYYFVVTERGVEFSRKRTTDVDELLYWIMEGLTFSMSVEFELRHRRAGEDFRRQMFAKEVELLAELSPEWAARQQREHDEILRRHPFRDG